MQKKDGESRAKAELWGSPELLPRLPSRADAIRLGKARAVLFHNARHAQERSTATNRTSKPQNQHSASYKREACTDALMINVPSSAP
jgi:hypothetical protein